ncbi:Beta-carotene isomerase D27, chloroplastic [Quillaja saponaria]|uniref:Beta-carotene isomerase D27, chloroplastic n=1 Tax=Quillaja saponaria TaxID=32244 RepID=A0AAD7VEP5_QUISA|nr:Beta-carotene isomerase D27, chloroplastic [Quillaja saponaria]
MKPLALVHYHTISWHPPSNLHSQPRIFIGRHRFSISCFSHGSQSVNQTENTTSKLEYKPGIFDDLFLNLFRNKLVEEVGWDSEKPGYDGLIEVANRLMMKGRTNSDTREATVRILRSLFPPFLLELYQMLIAPIGGGKVAAMMVARVTALTCQWLMGPCTVNFVDLPDGTSCRSGVFVERCKYLEESKCIGICINTCKLPTQTFFKDHMGVPLLMEPNFSGFSCQFKFGVLPPLPQDDSTLKEPCLEECPNATKRRVGTRNTQVPQCPKA